MINFFEECFAGYLFNERMSQEIDNSFENFITEKDGKLIKRLQNTENAILDDVCQYYLNRVGCKTTDISVVRFVSLAIQVTLEEILDDAISLCIQRKAELNPTSNKKTMDSKDLDVDSFCSAFQKHDDAYIGQNYDLFLEVKKPDAKQ